MFSLIKKELICGEFLHEWIVRFMFLFVCYVSELILALERLVVETLHISLSFNLIFITCLILFYL